MLLADGSPLHKWFDRAALNNILEEHRTARVDHGKRLYALAMLGFGRTSCSMTQSEPRRFPSTLEYS